ncbi:ATP-binding protein [Bifidobacterium sp. ESL0798]|uniref:ATP-binding protein n=1 Tax=Bifidobacterium sp. ESL0798 TaxID=2983235 RepID=UPI0023F7F8FA|nr:ATP-binding protein [Bifidobacterium sp. ESL0798]WEV74497.1 ATP-binding protein [Bifidobacterium sp. ESL0798]
MKVNESWRIGTICYIDQQIIRFRAVTTDISDRLFAGDLRHINSLNQYLFSYLDMSVKVIFKIISVQEDEKPYSKDLGSKLSKKYVFTAIPLGELEGNHYKPGVTDLPMVGSDIFACDDRELKSIFATKQNNTATIGKLAGYNDVRPEINLDACFQGHMAILGNTGSGKSTTARLLLSRIAEKLCDNTEIKDSALFVVFDLHGDYKVIFDKYHQKDDDKIHYYKAEDYYLTAGELKIEDWSSIVLPSERIQKPLLERALEYAKLSDTGKKQLYATFAFEAIHDTSVDSHAARRFQLMKYIRLIEPDLSPLCAQHDFSITKGSGYKQYEVKVEKFKDLTDAFTLNYGEIDSKVIDALETLLSDFLTDEFMKDGYPDKQKILSESTKDIHDITISDVDNALDFVFDEEEVGGNRQARSYSTGLVTQLHNLNERYRNNLFDSKKENALAITNILEKDTGLLIIDVSGISDDDGLKLLSTFIARRLFKRNIDLGESRSDNPVSLVFDEAHRYIRQDAMESDSIFNQIAREGRKFGVNLTIISQIPNELSRVVLSQTSTFIIHRIQNSIDLDYIKRNVPAISSDQVARLSSFSPGTAVILGSSMEMPIEIQVDGTYKYSTPPISFLKEKEMNEEIVVESNDDISASNTQTLV